MYNPNYPQQLQPQPQQPQRQTQYHMFQQHPQHQQQQQQVHQQHQQQQQRPQLQQLQNMHNYGPVRYQVPAGNVSLTNIPNHISVQSRPLSTFYRQNEAQNTGSGTVRTANLYFTGRDKQTIESAEHVKIKGLPFYEVKQVMIKQKCLVPTRTVPSDPRNPKSLPRAECQLEFGLTIQQCSLISASKELVPSTNKVDFGHQLQLRFALLNVAEEQDDDFPPSIVVKVNGKQIQLPALIPSNYPGTPARQPSRPLNITTQAKLRPVGFNPTSNNSNVILVSWMQDATGKDWVVSLNLVKKLSASDLFERMKQKGNLEPTVTRKMIHSIMKADGDDIEMALTSLTVSVGCPIGKSRMAYPCRATSCSHIQCFDAVLYLQMNEKKPVWSCPVCNKKILYDNLQVDGFFVDVIKDLPSTSSNDIEIMPDGSWKQIEPNADEPHNTSTDDLKVKPKTGGSTAAPCSNLQSEIEMISIDDDSDSETGKSCVNNSTKNQQKTVSVPTKPVPNGNRKPTSSEVRPTAPVLISLDDSDDEAPTSSSSSKQNASSSASATNSNISHPSVTVRPQTAPNPTPTGDYGRSNNPAQVPSSAAVAASSAIGAPSPTPGPSYPSTRWASSGFVAPPRPPSQSNPSSRFNDDDDDIICLSD